MSSRGARPDIKGSRVPVLGHDTGAFLSAVRSLGRADLLVDVADFGTARSVALGSRYVYECVTLSEIERSIADWVEALDRVVAERGYDFVLPCTDIQVGAVQSLRSSLRRTHVYALAPREVFEIASNKQLTRALPSRRIRCCPAHRESAVRSADSTHWTRSKS